MNSAIDWASAIFGLLGGLGLFLYGINKMGDSLKELAGSKLKVIIEKTTNTPLKGILVGFLITALIQSSSGTTALTVGLVRVGLMTLPQAVGVIMGANIGTTFTSFLIGLKIKTYALPIIFIGSSLIFFFKKRNIVSLGGVIFGFGLLFFGLSTMGNGMKQITELQQVADLFVAMEKMPVIGVFVGAIITGVVQSSSATVGLLQTIYGAGNIGLLAAIPILLGTNIGTTVTAIFASLGGTAPAKRAALIHVIFNVFGALLFMIILIPYVRLIGYIETRWLWDGIPGSPKPEMTIAIAHMIFNIVTTFIMFWFINYLVKFATKIIPGEPIDEMSKGLIDDTLINESPVLALEFSKSAINRMGDMVKALFNTTKEYSFENEKGLLVKGLDIEEEIDLFNSRIHDYLIKITRTELGFTESHRLSKYIDTISDLERIADHCVNILEFFQERYNINVILSKDGEKDLNKLYDLLEGMLNDAVVSLVDNNKDIIADIDEREEQVDKLEDKFRRNHLLRLNNGQCSLTTAENYTDILSNLERIGDHCNNIARTVIHDYYVLEKED